MARDKILFIASFLCLGLLVALLFGRSKTAPVETAKPVQVNVEEVKERTSMLPLAQGKVAVPVELNSRAAVAQFLIPGSFVDIRFTSKVNVTPEVVSLILLKNIRVLNIGKDSAGKFYDEKGVLYKSNTPTEVVLEMTPEQSEVLAYA
ncbi:MAG: RcpC/CpaB family pilus assembly protein [Parachlamydiaceae bacterium]